MGNDYRVSAAAVARAMTHNTVLVVASSPCFPHGVIDDVSGIAAVRPVPCHVSFTYMHFSWKTFQPSKVGHTPPCGSADSMYFVRLLGPLPSAPTPAHCMYSGVDLHQPALTAKSLVTLVVW